MLNGHACAREHEDVALGGAGIVEPGMTDGSSEGADHDACALIDDPVGGR
jgi:hypothetical protein